MATQWIAFVVLLLAIAGLAFAFVRHGVKIKPDPENKPENPHIMGGGY